MHYHIDPNIKKASTLDSSFYTSKKVYRKLISSLFKNSWQFIGDDQQLEHHNCIPISLYGEEILLSMGNDHQLRCLSNVCTHRGNILITNPGKYQKISCRYHGRCFNLDGKFLSMPAFSDVESFPSKKDHLKDLPLKEFGPFIFTNISPKPSNFDAWLQPLKEKMNWFPFHQLKAVPEFDKEYHLKAHWALYCDNYLEGFHVPFVHEKLNNTIDYGHYKTEIIDKSILQTGYSKQGEVHFNESHGFTGREKVYAFYWFLFPNLMINFYTWGISLNLIKPVSKTKTIIQFKTYMLDTASDTDFDQTYLHETEMEDEDIILGVQKGVQSKFYTKGRYSPAREQGVHFFHRLLADSLNK